MRAFAVDRFGDTGSIREVPEPVPREGQVRVRVEAASVNPADVAMLGGAYKDFMEHRFPLVPGFDLGGTVDAIGPAVDGLRVGNLVFGTHGTMVAGAGTFAEFAVASASTLARRPPTVDAPFGAALSLAGVSALQLADEAALQPGDAVLVIGAAGGIGSIVLQLAAAAGAAPIAVARTVNHAYVRSLGAREAVDYTNEDVVETVRATHPEGIAAILDMIGDKEQVNRLAELVRPGGHVISMLRGADIDHLAARGINGVRMTTQVTTEKLKRLAAAVEAGAVRRPQIRSVGLDEAASALTEMAGGHVRGKIVVLP